MFLEKKYKEEKEEVEYDLQIVCLQLLNLPANGFGWQYARQNIACRSSTQQWLLRHFTDFEDENMIESNDEKKEEKKTVEERLKEMAPTWHLQQQHRQQ